MEFDPFDLRFARLEQRFSARHAEHIREWLASHQRAFRASPRSSSSGGAELEIAILDVIGEDWWGEGVSAKQVRRALNQAGNVKTIRVILNSPGGAVWDGFAIQALLKRHPARVEIEVLGEAASAASVIAMAGDDIAVHEGGFLMIHEAWTLTWGKAAQLRADAELLEKLNEAMVDLYVRRTGADRKLIVELVEAETWLSAAEALELGFADAVIPGKAKPGGDKRGADERPRSRSSAMVTPLRQLLTAGGAGLGQPNRRPTLGALMRKPWT